jgi:hypothetical protein
VSYFEPVTFSAEEAQELRALVWQAWEIQEQHPEHLSDAAAAIVEWRERLPLSRLERRQAREAAA